jgi:hypothetical protein
MQWISSFLPSAWNPSFLPGRNPSYGCTIVHMFSLLRSPTPACSDLEYFLFSLIQTFRFKMLVLEDIKLGAEVCVHGGDY